MFPQLIAGPIVRYTEVVTEIDKRTVSLDDMSQGIVRFAAGLAKKTLVANTMAVVVDQIWGHGAGNNAASVAWLGSLAYALQIYYDFSGYSDMATGLGRMLGFHFGENFNLPYISKSITEFWRRWHISLSSWFRDYVYIPLGGNRRRVYLNLAIVFLLTGIWHGASWNFILWGIWNGLFVLLERFLKIGRGKRAIEQTPVFRVLSRFYTLFIVNLGWVLFRAPTLSDAVAFIKNMFGLITARTGYPVAFYANGWTLTMMIYGVPFATGIPSKAAGMIAKKMNPNVVLVLQYASALFLVFASAVRIVSGTYNPFIYFQF